MFANITPLKAISGVFIGFSVLYFFVDIFVCAGTPEMQELACVGQRLLEESQQSEQKFSIDCFCSNR